MPLTDITVQFVNQPKPGKRMGSIKSSEGEYYGCPPTLLGQFRAGEVCKIDFNETPKDGGGTWKNITRKIAGAGPPPVIQLPRQRTNPGDSEQIYTTALLKEFIAAGKLDLRTDSLVAATNAVREAYRQTFGGVEKRRDEEMDDSIPY